MGETSEWLGLVYREGEACRAEQEGGRHSNAQRRRGLAARIAASVASRLAASVATGVPGSTATGLRAATGLTPLGRGRLARARALAAAAAAARSDGSDE